MHRANRYAEEKPDFTKLAQSYPTFAPFVRTSSDGQSYIDFKNAEALRSLSTTLLKENWKYDVELREDRLCPTLASRLDYVLHILDLEGYLELSMPEVAHDAAQNISTESQAVENRETRVLDIGTGHVAIYPLLIHRLRPRSTILATESDQTSFDHAQATLVKNDIPKGRIELIKAISTEMILSPLKERSVDVVICNPPFYASRQELEEGMKIKAVGPHAAPTASSNELITRGGEVAFVGQMIKESLELKEQAKWFTSLIGIYSSLQPLVDMLRTNKIDNYFVKSIKPARTSRWILGWSFGKVHLPDSMTRPDNVHGGTSFVKVISPARTLRHTPLHPPLSVEQLREAIEPVLVEVKLSPGSAECEAVSDGYVIKPKINTWSRAARRQAARAENAGEEAPTVDSSAKDPLFIAQLAFLGPRFSAQPETTASNNEAKDDTDDGVKTSGTSSVVNARLTLEWTYGEDREIVDAFWKFLLTKAGLLGSDVPAGGAKRAYGGEDSEERGSRGRGRGGRGGRRGRGRIAVGSRW